MRGLTRGTVALGVSLLALFAGTRTAGAEDDDALARELFDRAKRLFMSGDAEGACRTFRSIRPLVEKDTLTRAIILMDEGRVCEQAGSRGYALAAYSEALAVSERQCQAPCDAEHLDSIRKEANLAIGRLRYGGTIIATLTTPDDFKYILVKLDDATVKRDDEPLDASKLPMLMSSGRHTVTVRRGAQEWRTSLVVGGTEDVSLRVPADFTGPARCRDAHLSGEWFYLRTFSPFGSCGSIRHVSFWSRVPSTTEKRRPAEWTHVTLDPTGNDPEACVAIRVPDSERPPAVLVEAEACEFRVEQFPAWTSCRSPGSPCKYEMRRFFLAYPGGRAPPPPPPSSRGCACRLTTASEEHAPAYGWSMLAPTALFVRRHRRATQPSSRSRLLPGRPRT